MVVSVVASIVFLVSLVSVFLLLSRKSPFNGRGPSAGAAGLLWAGGGANRESSSGGCV